MNIRSVILPHIRVYLTVIDIDHLCLGSFVLPRINIRL